MPSRSWTLAAALIPLTAAAQTIAPAGNAEIIVVNQSSWSIHRMYLSPTSVSNWGEDRLGTQVLPPGSKLTLSDIACDSYDVRIVDQDGDQCIVNAVTMCGDQSMWKLTNEALLSCMAETAARVNAASATAPATVTPASTSTVTIANQSLWTINQFFMSSSTDTTWGPDQLGSQIIAPNGSFTVQNIPCGEYDLKVVDEDGDSCVVPKISLCGTEANWNLTNEVLLGCQKQGQTQ